VRALASINLINLSLKGEQKPIITYENDRQFLSRRAETKMPLGTSKEAIPEGGVVPLGGKP
jgi:hypothetical protein